MRTTATRGEDVAARLRVRMMTRDIGSSGRAIQDSRAAEHRVEENVGADRRVLAVDLFEFVVAQAILARDENHSGGRHAGTRRRSRVQRR